MTIIWYIGTRKRQCDISCIDEIERYTEQGKNGETLYCISVDRTRLLPASALGKFRNQANCNESYEAIRFALESGSSEYIFRKSFFER